MTKSEAENLVRQAQKYIGKQLVFRHSTNGPAQGMIEFMGTNIEEDRGDYLPKSVIQLPNGKLIENDLQFDIDRFSEHYK